MKEIRDYESAQKWFRTLKEKREERARKRALREPLREANDLNRLKRYCDHLHMTPDQLANVTFEKAKTIQIKLLKILYNEDHFKSYSRGSLMSTLHSFWYANVAFTKEQKKELNKFPDTPEETLPSQMRTALRESMKRRTFVK